MATMREPAPQPPESLERKLLKFDVSENWGDTNQHDALQKFLETNALWGDEFRYGWAESSSSTERELRNAGMAESQPRANGDSLMLFTKKDSRDFYADADFFFKGRKVVVVYAIDGLRQTGSGRSYELLDRSALVAIVGPVFNL